MIKKLRSSLTSKIFLITMLLLALCCGLTYFFIALFMPYSYSSNVSADTEQRAWELVDILPDLTFEEALEVLQQFVFDTGAELSLEDSEGNPVELPLRYQVSVIYDGLFLSIAASEEGQDEPSTAQAGAVVVDVGEQQAEGTVTTYTVNQAEEYALAEDTPWPRWGFYRAIASTFTVDVMFADRDEVYYLTVATSITGVNQAVVALGQIFPWLVLLILLISLAASLFYSRFVTRPIVKLSAISQKMAELDFSWQCEEQRRDEIGLLGQSLNQLSARLSRSLRELREANAALRDDIQRERELEQKRMEFFAAVSHELKTPITVIKGQLEGMLLNVGSYQDRDKYLSRSLQVAATLERMVQEILTVSRLESSGFALQSTEFDLSAPLREQAEQYAELFEQKGLKFQAEIAETLPVRGDAQLLTKAVSNLLSNAAHYSPPGERVYLSAQARPEGVCVTVENTGVHIPEESLPRLFEAFYRVEQSRNRQSGGSGLGLYLVKMILEQHGAVFGIENTAAGVQFRFRLPGQ